jgi:hypothetical protein
MFSETITRARHWAGPLACAVVLFIFGYTSPTLSTWTLILYGLALVLGLWAVVNFAFHLTQMLSTVWRESMELKYRFSDNFAGELISQMNSDQLRAWGRGGRIQLDVQAGEKGPVEYVRGEQFFLYTAWYILKNSVGRNVYPIHNFREGTFHFDMWGDHKVDDVTQAREFTAYLCRYGWAKWPAGNSSARFEEGYDAEKVMGFFGLSADSYGVEELGE